MKLLIAGILTIFISYGAIVSLHPQFVGAQSSLVCDGLSPDTDGGGCSPAATEPDAGGIIETGINILSIVAGIISVAVLMLAGVKFITSQGDSGKVSSARSTALYAIIGLVIVAISQVIVFFVLGSVAPAPAETGLNNIILVSSVDN